MSDVQVPVLQHLSTKNIRETQLQDNAIGFVLHALELNNKPEPTTLQGQSPEVR